MLSLMDRAASVARIFVDAEPGTAARVLFTPSGAVHRRIVAAQREVFLEDGDLEARASCMSGSGNRCSTAT
jgi:hypothetical protein